MLKHDRPVVGCVGSAVGSVVGGLLRTVDKSAQAISLQVKNDLALPFDLSDYTNFGVLSLIVYLVPTCVGEASFAPRG